MDKRIRTSLFSTVCAAWLCVSISVHAFADDALPGWQLVSSREGVQVYRREEPGTPLSSFRAVTHMPLRDFRSLWFHFDDYAFMASWLHKVTSIEDIGRSSPMERFVYLTLRMPWPVQHRDVILRLSLLQHAQTHTFKVLFHSVEGIRPPQPGYLRMPMVKGHITFKPLVPGQVEVTFETQADFGGDAPQWFAHMVLRDIPLFSLQAYRRVVDHYSGTGHQVPYLTSPPGWPVE